MFRRDCGIRLRRAKRHAVPRFSPQRKVRYVPQDQNLDPRDDDDYYYYYLFIYLFTAIGL